jgi:hypothetical protein
VVVLLSAPNARNLAVPQDAAGERGLDAVARAFPDSQPVRRPLSADEALMERDVWAPLHHARKDQKLVLFVAAHGGADERGAYLLPEGADPADPDNVVRVADLLGRLKKVPCEQKLLVLDATQVPWFWPLGQLHNDFARALAAEVERERVPGLVVLAASGPDQQSWVSEGWQTTAFAHAVAEGLTGAADAPPHGDGNRHVTALELHRYATAEIDRWVRANRNAAQAPVLLDPGGRASKMDLAVAGPGRPSGEADEVARFAPPPELTSAWQAAEALRRERPAAYAPHLWRRYLDTALRLEELARAGAADDVARLRKDLDALGQQVRDARRLPVGPLSCSLALPAALGDALPPADVERLRQPLDRLWERKDAGDDEFARLADGADGQKGNPRGLALRQAALADLLLRRAAARPATDLARAARRLPRFDGPRPTEAEPLPFLAEHLAADCPVELTRRALEARRRGERAALGLADADADLPPCSEQVRPWVRAAIEAADADRRVGEDLLLSSRRADWDDANGRLTAAEQAYRRAQDEIARPVRRALVLRAEALAELPYYSRWLVERPPAADAADVDRLEVLWGHVHELDRLLEQPEPAAAADLDRLAGTVGQELAELRAGFDRTCDSYAAQDAALQDSYHQIDALLRVPFIPARQRESLLRNLGTISHALQTKGTQAAGVGEAPAAEAARARTERSARLALATLGGEWVRAVADRVPPAAGDLKREGRPAEDWLKAIDQAGVAVRFHWGRWLTEANRLGDEARSAPAVDGPGGSLPLLARAAALARCLDGAAAGRLAGDPVDDYRRLQGSELLAWLAWRSARDDWGGDGPAPYFRRVAHEYLDAALNLVLAPARERDLKAAQRAARKDRVAQARTRIDAIKDPALEWYDRDASAGAGRPAPGVFPSGPARLELTVDDEWPREHRVRVPAEAGPAAPVVFARAGKFLRAVADDQARRSVPVRAGEEASPTVTFTLALAPLPEGPPPPRLRTEHFAGALYRGRVLGVRTDVGAHFVPETVAWRPEAEQARVAVQAAPELYQRYAEGHGRVTIVLDCSQSMSTPQTVAVEGRVRTATRFELALDALERVLKEVPRGTRVSLWAFGQEKEGLRVPDDVEKTIQRVLAPQAWDPDRPEQLAGLMADVRKLRPYSWSPILRAMLDAKADLLADGAGEEGGHRTLLVLTDGMDNRFEGRIDKDYNPDGKKAVADALREQFERTGIAVKMIGFQLEKAELQAARQQFGEPIRRLPQGEFIPDAERIDDLVEKLRKALRQRLAYRVAPAGGAGAAPAGEQTVTRIGNNPAWARLGAGEYVVSVQASRPLAQRVKVRLGESLLLKLVQRDGELALERVLYARTADPVTLPPPAKAGDWLLGSWQDRRDDHGVLEVTTTLESTERLSSRPGESLEQPRPGLVWFQVTRGAESAPAAGLSFHPLYNEPAPAWRLAVPDWPTRAAPSVKAWWGGPDLRPRALTLTRGPDYGASPEELRNRAFPAQDLLDGPSAAVVVESVRWAEKRKVQVTPGVWAERDCLVVQLRYPAGQPFFVRLPAALRAAGEEHRLWTDAHKYVGVFWSLTHEQVAGLPSLSLVSLENFKAAAEEAGLSRVVPLPPPR